MTKTNDLSFADLLADSWVDYDVNPHEAVEVEVIAVDDNFATLAIYANVEGVVAVREFENKPKVGDKVKVIVSALDDGQGAVDVSHSKAIDLESRDIVKAAIEEKSIIEVKVKLATRAGLITQFHSVEGFLPKSHLIGDHEDPNLIGRRLKVIPIGEDEKKNNIIVSQKEALIQERGGKLETLEGEVKVGDELEGIVKNIMPFGAFVDLGGRDCLIHVTAMTWNPLDAKPADLLEVGQRIKGVINKADEKGRIFMSIRNNDMGPWEAVKAARKVGDKVEALVYKIEDKKNLLVIIDGVLGKVPLKEISWNFPKPNELKALIGKKIEATVTAFDETAGNEVVMLSIKAAQPNPWEKAKDELVEGRILSAPIKSITEHNVFVKVADNVDAIVPYREIDWMNQQRKLNSLTVGDDVMVKLITVDHEEQKVTASIKQCDDNPYEGLSKNKTVLAKITGFSRDGSGVELDIIEIDGEEKKIKAFSNSRLATSLNGVKADEYHEVGDKLSARVVNIGADKVLLDLRNRSMNEHVNGSEANLSLKHAFAEANS